MLFYGREKKFPGRKQNFLAGEIFVLSQCLLDVSQDVVDVFDADRKADEVRGDAGLNQLLVGQLAMRMTGGMEHTGAGIGHMRDDANHLQPIHKADGILACSFQPEGEHAAGTVRHILASQFVIFVTLQTRIADPCDLVARREPFGYLLRVAAVLLHTQVQRFQS